MSDALHLKRAQAYLKVGNRFEDAIADATAVTVHREHNTKTHWLLALGHYEARQFVEALHAARKALDTMPDTDSTDDVCKKDIVAFVESVNCRLKEQSTGEYDFCAMRRMLLKEGSKHLDIADYLSPAVEIRQSESMGYGVFAKKDIKFGDLVFVEKAFAVAWADENEPLLHINTVTNHITTGGYAHLIDALITKTHYNPDAAARFFGLYGGDYPRDSLDENNKPLVIDGKAVIDSFLVDRIATLNCFTYGRCTADRYTDRYPTKNEDKDVGFWKTAARFNHRCFPNVERGFIGDIMIGRANTDISAGEQLYIWYLPASWGTYQERHEMFEELWGFTCRCPFCTTLKDMDPNVLDMQHTIVKNIEARLESAKAAAMCLPDNSTVNTIDNAANKIQVEIQALIETYDNTPLPTVVPRLPLAQTHVHLSTIAAILARAHPETTQFQTHINAGHAALNSLGYEFIESTSPEKEPVEVTRWGFACPIAVEAAWALGLGWEEKARHGVNVKVDKPEDHAREEQDKTTTAASWLLVSKGWKTVAVRLYGVTTGTEDGFGMSIWKDGLSAKRKRECGRVSSARVR